MHSHGRALNGLLPHAVGDLEEYHVREGELISGVVNGWNFGDGHLHSLQLLEAVQERCHFEPGEVRVITLESQPAHVQRQQYRIYDAATGLIEEGWVKVADMVARLPWLDESTGTSRSRSTRAWRRRTRHGRARVSEAVVVGSGPNGLSCAAALARDGREGDGDRGRGDHRRRHPLGRADAPGLIHDDCSAVHPMAVGAPALLEHDLARHGLEWCWPEVDLAHPLDDGTAGVMLRSIDATAAGLGADGRAWKRIFGSPSAGFAALGEDIIRPMLHLPRHPLRLVRFGLPRAGARDASLARGSRARGEGAVRRRRRARVRPLSAPMSSSVGMALICACHAYGWPVARGGSQAISERARRGRCAEHGGTIETGRRVASLAELPAADAVVLDLSPRAWPRSPAIGCPARVARAYRRYRYGPGRVQGRPRGGGRRAVGRRGRRVAPGPCTRSARSRRSSPAEREVEPRAGCRSGRSSSSASSRSPTRAARGRRRPSDLGLRPCPERLRGRRDRGRDRPDRALRARVCASGSSARFVRAPAELEAYNANYVGGDIITGANTAKQILFRPRVALDPYATGIPGVFICSAATPPGAGAHGMNGYNAARAALRKLDA